MDIFHRLVSEAPDIQDFRDSKPTLLVSWWCTSYAVFFILVRLGGRYIRTEKMFIDDAIMLGALLPLFVRQALVHSVLVHGTNNTMTDGLSTQSIHQREIGSQLVLATRVFYAASLWTVKYSTSMFLRTLTESVWQRSHQRYLRYLQMFLVVTFLATVVSAIATCQPFTHYWQVVPDPGPQCRNGYAHLLVTGTLNIVTNFTLIIFPIPMIRASRLPRTQKTYILLRLSLPLLSIALTSYAVPRILEKRGAQQFRSLLASFDVLLATFTSNALVLLSLLQGRGYRKTKYRAPPYSHDDQYALSKKPTSVGRRFSKWGSEEDLVGEDPMGEDVRDFRSDAERNAEKNAKRAAGVSVEEPPKAKLQDIRVEQTWKITVNTEAASRESDLEDLDH